MSGKAIGIDKNLIFGPYETTYKVGKAIFKVHFEGDLTLDGSDQVKPKDVLDNWLEQVGVKKLGLNGLPFGQLAVTHPRKLYEAACGVDLVGPEKVFGASLVFDEVALNLEKPEGPRILTTLKMPGARGVEAPVWENDLSAAHRAHARSAAGPGL